MSPAQVRRRILLINPNSSTATTVMMVAIARQAAAYDDIEVAGATATRSPRMIVEPNALAASAAEVGDRAR